MTGIDITPEVLWAVRRAAVLDANLPDSFVNELGDWAERLEREQADEKRIDELAEVFANALHEHDHQWSPWKPVTEKWREELRAGVRAVLAKLDESPFDKGGPTVRPLRQWGDLRDVPLDVLAVHTTEGEVRRNGSSRNSWRWINGQNVSFYGLTAYAPYTEIPSVEEPSHD